MRLRSLEPEIMDDPSLPTDQLVAALRELSFINRWLGGHRTSRIGIMCLIGPKSAGKRVSVLDVASGGTDLRKVFGNTTLSVDVTAVDRNGRALAIAVNDSTQLQRVIGSAHQLPFRSRSFDLVHVSLFLHHCTDEEAVELLRSSLRIARTGVIVNELHRHWLAHLAIRVVTGLFSRSDVVRHDAPTSVRRGFTRKELTALSRRAGAVVERCSWQWAFRWNLCLREAGVAAHE